MKRLVSLLVCGLVLSGVFAGLAAWGPSSVAQEGQEGNDPARDRTNLSLDQQRIQILYKELQEKLLKLADITEASDPQRAELLRKAFKQGSEKRIEERLAALVKTIGSEQFGLATREQKGVKDDLDALLKLLMAEGGPQRLTEQKKRLEAYLRAVQRLIKDQQEIDDTIPHGNTGQLTGRQDRVADNTKKVGDDIAKNEGLGKSGDGKSGDSKSGDGKSGDGKSGDGKSKSGDGKSGDGKSGDGKSGDGKSKSGDGKSGDGKSKSGDGKSGDGKSKSGDGKSGDGKSGDGKSKSGDGKSGDGKSGDGKSKSGDGKSGDGKSGDGKSKSGDGKSGDGKSKSSKSKGGGGSESDPRKEPGEGEPGESEGEQTPQDKLERTKKRIYEAEKRMREAKQRLEKAEREGAKAESEQALAELRKIEKELEDLLRQLREEELERLLAFLEARFKKMRDMEVAVYEGTLRLDRTPIKQRAAAFTTQAGRLSRDQSLIEIEAEKALNLLREDGTSVAMTEAVTEMIGDMKQVQVYLAQAKTSEIPTQQVEEDIIAALDEMIEALKRNLRNLRDPPKSRPGDGGPPPDPSLIDLLAEVKMLRSLQMRVNNRTERYRKQLANPDDDIGTATKEDLIKGLDELREREDRIFRATRDIVTGRNK